MERKTVERVIRRKQDDIEELVAFRNIVLYMKVIHIVLEDKLV